LQQGRKNGSALVAVEPQGGEGGDDNAVCP
jgi:hypothetical protein